MAKKHFIKIEYSVLMCFIIGIFLLIVPFSIGNTRQAGFISRWNETYNRIDYMFTVINTHISTDMIKSMKKAETPAEREKLLLMIIKPYLRINTENSHIKYYNPRYKNGNKLSKGELYYFDEIYFAKDKTIIGIKDIQSETSDAFFMMMFDINGILPPNKWGYDIFGINIYDGGRIEPFGFDSDMSDLVTDCSSKGTGITCSYYYKIGGRFDD